MIPKAISPKTSVQPISAPRWAAPATFAADTADAAFMAGGALYPLDQVVRTEPDWLGAWRQRLALKCAAAAVRFSGRSEDEAGLRDAWLLRKPGTIQALLGRSFRPGNGLPPVQPRSMWRCCRR
uniref:DUF1403 family protein n=1 Tax=Neorhizobium sp. EC2-8 TaxID=3129230 RepID=UPI0031011BC4